VGRSGRWVEGGTRSVERVTSLTKPENVICTVWVEGSGGE